MIAKRIKRESAASSFVRLGRYILNDGRENLAVTDRIAAYILDLDGEGGKACNVRITNCVSDNPADAIREIVATQSLNVRARGDKTYHLVVSFAPGERPSDTQLAEIEAALCEAIGLGAHQRLSAVHTDTGHFHVHIAINKVHPETFRMIEPYYDHAKLMTACERLEQKHGLQRTSHGDLKRDDAVRRELARNEREHIRELVKRLLGPECERKLQEFYNWEGLHSLFREDGLSLRRRGAGFVIVNNANRVAVKASSIDKALSLASLCRRFGPFRLPERLRAAPWGAAEMITLAAIKASYAKRATAIKHSTTLTAVGKRTEYRKLQTLRNAAYTRFRENTEKEPHSARRSGPTPEAELERRHTSTPATGDKPLVALAKLSALDRFICERNALREQISNIFYHCVWTETDAGPALYCGRRRLPDCTWALMFEKDGTMLVKPATDLEASRARMWSVGRRVVLDERGRAAKRGRAR